MFHFIRYLKHINKVRIYSNFNKLIYSHILEESKVFLNISNCDISPFQLIDILKALNNFRELSYLQLDFSNNYRLNYRNLKNFLNELICVKYISCLSINLFNTNISELEFLVLYSLVWNIKDL